MSVPLTTTAGLVALGVFGMLDQSPIITGISTVGIAGLQVWTLMQLQPIRDQVGQLKTEVAVLRQRLDDCQHSDCPFFAKQKEPES